MKIPTFSIVNLRPIHQGALIATCTVRVNHGPLFHECRIILESDNRLRVSPPQRSWVDTDSGKKSYLQLAEWPKSWQNLILNACLAAYQDSQVDTLARSDDKEPGVENEVKK